MHPSAKRLLDAAREATRGRARPILTFADLYKDMGESAQTMNNWKAPERGVSKEGAIKAERLYGCSVSWVMDGKENSLQNGKPITAESIQNGRTVGPQLIEWGDMMGGDLPEVFRVVMLDDAMAPDAEIGWEVEFERATSARPGQGVLVRDDRGDVYFRRYTEGAEGEWSAAPNKRGFRTLEYPRHGIAVIAVMLYVRTPSLR